MALACAGRDVYYTRRRSQWLEKIPEAGTRRRAEQLYQQLDLLQRLRQQARREDQSKRRYALPDSSEPSHENLEARCFSEWAGDIGGSPLEHPNICLKFSQHLDHLLRYEGMAHLFAGAIGLYKNPQSHQSLPTSAEQAAEVVMFASQLLRIVDRVGPPQP
jgi:hypothetical protein